MQLVMHLHFAITVYNASQHAACHAHSVPPTFGKMLHPCARECILGQVQVREWGVLRSSAQNHKHRMSSSSFCGDNSLKAIKKG
jgi:hypothetical protein